MREGIPGIRVAACAMVFADRNSREFIQEKEVERLEKVAGKAMLKAITKFNIGG